MLFRIGLTGGIASGKSTAEAVCHRMGLPVIDADVITHNLLSHDETLRQQIYNQFGPDMFDPSGQINRKALGAVVFRNDAARKQLEQWIHPKVRQAIGAFFAEAARQQGQHKNTVAVASIPLVFESGLDLLPPAERLFDAIALVVCEPEVQQARLMQTRGMSLTEAQQRMACQLSVAEKIARVQAFGSFAIWDNNQTKAAFQQQVECQLTAWLTD